MFKKETRVVGIDDAPFDKFKKGKALVVGTIFRGGHWIDGILSTNVEIDGSDSTKKIISMINKCKFKPQLQCILLNGIAFGGFNIVDIEELNRKTRIPIIVVIRKRPDFKKIKKTLKNLGKIRKYKLIEKAGDVTKLGRIFIQIKGIKLKEAKEILKITCTRSLIPEPIRIAHLIGAGIIKGESRGDA